MSLISIGQSGLAATQAALATTSNNIANAATTGYSRQNVVTSASSLQNIGVGYLGTGTTISDVRRVYNSFMDSQLQTSTALSADAKAFQAQASSIDKLLSDSGTGISSVLTSFFSSLQSAAAAPTDTASRQLLLTQAQTLSNRFNALSTQMSQQNESLNSQLSTLSGQVNKLSSSIASLNQQISEMSATGSTPNSLLDARNEAVRSLNELVGVTVQNNNGMYDVYMGTGQSLVSGVNSNVLSAKPSGTDSGQYALTLTYGSYSTDVTAVTTGGEIGGLLRYRNDVLTPAVNELGRVAIVVADAINSQLGQGLDANGEFGSTLFSSINSAAAQASRSLAATTNSAGSGNLNVNITDPSKLSTYDYQVKFSSPTDYTVTRSDGVVTSGLSLNDDPPKEIDGFTLDLRGGALSDKDSFKVVPTRTGAATITTTLTDSNKLAFAGPLSATGTTGNSGTSTITQPTLTSKLDIYDSTALSQAQSAIEHSMPVKLVLGAASGGSQPYTVYDSKGVSIGTGTVVPGQDNKLTINVPVLDSTGAPVYEADGVTRKTIGFDTTIGGTAATNDSYTINFNDTGVTDNRNAQSLLALQTTSTIGVSGGSSGISFTSAYASLVERVGSKTNQANVDVTATDAVLKQAKANRDSVSGVNLDDEASSLLKFQQYYTASSQIIKTAQEIFSTLINAL